MNILQGDLYDLHLSTPIVERFRGLESIPVVFRREAGYTVHTGQTETDIHLHSHSHQLGNLESNLHVFPLGEEISVPGGNPHKLS